MNAVPSGCRSGFKGVSYLRQSNKFRARINILGLTCYVGYFAEAAQ